jgi:DNA polymerase IV
VDGITRTHRRPWVISVEDVPQALPTGVAPRPVDAALPGHAGVVAQPWIFHVDLDEFIAAVEILRRPELADRPVVVGGDGDPSKRGVVSTANYVARRYGIGSAMPLRTAYKRCPEAVFLPVDGDAYLAASHEVMDVLRSFPGVVQVMGWDEAFMGIAANDPEALARLVQARVLERTGLWCSIGIGDTKLRAKLASGFAKPRGLFRLTRDNWFDVMGAQPTEQLWGIGAKTARKLADIGIRTVEQLAAADDSMMASVFGPRTGPWIRELATGEGSDQVTAEPHVPRGVSREHTFQVDVADPDEVRQELTKLAYELIDDVRRDGRSVARVGIKVRFRPFVTKTRSITLPAPITDEEGLARGARAALAKLELTRPVRLIGVRAEFADADPKRDA